MFHWIKCYRESYRKRMCFDHKTSTNIYFSLAFLCKPRESKWICFMLMQARNPVGKPRLKRLHVKIWTCDDTVMEASSELISWSIDSEAYPNQLLILLQETRCLCSTLHKKEHKFRNCDRPLVSTCLPLFSCSPPIATLQQFRSWLVWPNTFSEMLSSHARMSDSSSDHTAKYAF